SRSDSILDNNSLNIKFLLDLRQRHDAHSERNLEQIKFSSKNNNERNVLNKFNINKASTLFPLQIRSFIIAKFDNMLCIAQVIAMYEQDNLFHLYIDTSVSDLESLSYISLKIFFHINGAVFSTTRDHQFYIFSHPEGSYIVHHLASKDINIDKE
ncbi:11649_t:CDS:2, partial [Racocetra fulgida]